MDFLKKITSSRLYKDLKGSWILFFYYMKWPIFLGLPILYFVLDYKRNIIMEIVWFYCLYLIIEDIFMRFKGNKRC